MKPLKPDYSDPLEAEPAQAEPLPHGPALRQFKDPSYKPLSGSLADARAGIDALDLKIIALIAERAMFVKDAARFQAILL